MEYKIFITIILLAATANVIIGAGLGIPISVEGKSASSSGYSHGQKDCEGNHDDMYITGVNKHGESTGPDHHTQVFMDNYYRGWSDAGCDSQELNDILYPAIYSDNTNTAVDDSFNNRDSVVQPQSQSASTVQS